MNIIIHRGSNQIGGNIVEISTETTRILLDVGKELDGDGDDLPEVEGLFENAAFDAVFISHYHKDHVGLAYGTDKDIPIYIGERSYKILKAADEYFERDTSVYTLLSEFPSAHQIAEAHITRLKTLLSDASNGRYGRDKAVEIRDAAKNSIGSKMPAKSLELKHTIQIIREMDVEIDEIETEINSIMNELHSTITTIPGIGVQMGAMILAEIGDFSNFESADKILAYAGMSPSTYQSGQFTSNYSHMEKRGSRYLRYAIFNATRYVCIWDPTFSDYLAKKRAEGKHYYVAISHAAKKLVRLIYALEKSKLPYSPTT